VKKGH